MQNLSVAAGSGLSMGPLDGHARIHQAPRSEDHHNVNRIRNSVVRIIWISRSGKETALIRVFSPGLRSLLQEQDKV
jgi:hypothetical protein